MSTADWRKASVDKDFYAAAGISISSLAYWYGKNGSLAGIGLTSAMEVLSDGNSANIGAIAQQLRPFSGIQEGLVQLA